MEQQTFKQAIKDRFLGNKELSEGDQMALLRYCESKGVKHVAVLKQALQELITEEGFALFDYQLSEMQRALMNDWKAAPSVHEHENILQEYRNNGLSKYDHLPVIKALKAKEEK